MPVKLHGSAVSAKKRHLSCIYRQHQCKRPAAVNFNHLFGIAAVNLQPLYLRLVHRNERPLVISLNRTLHNVFFNSAKAAAGSVLVVDGLKLDEVKTKTMQGFLNALEAGKPVVITADVDNNVVLSARNIPGVVTTTAKVLSVYDIVNAKQLVIDKAALAIIEEVYA